jgi:hypothetical protein
MTNSLTSNQHFLIVGLLTLDTRPESRVSNELRQRYVGAGGVNNFDLGLMSDAAESRVTDWIQQQQREMMEEDVVPETDPEIIFQNLQVDRIRLKLGSLLQEGTFGRVYQVGLKHPKLTCTSIYNTN